VKQGCCKNDLILITFGRKKNCMGFPGQRNPPKFKKHVSILSSTTRSKPSVVLVSWLRFLVSCLSMISTFFIMKSVLMISGDSNFLLLSHIHHMELCISVLSVFVALGIQRAVRMQHIVNCGIIK
jgi:hypothetical protein